ncbi:FCD domain-containing protein [Terrilactibacillus sp. S3-3]|nr:FCD domain-containing protein [Terrilactibacillus sp. S3-3]
MLKKKPIIVPDLMFHGTLAKSTKNEVIIQVYSSLVEFFKKLRMEMVINDDVDNAFFYHKEILKAIKEKNSEKSSMLMRRHIEDVQLHYKKKMLNEMGVND